MALEAVEFSQGHFGYGQAPGLGPWCDMVGAGGFFEDCWDQQLLAAPVAPNAEDQWEPGDQASIVGGAINYVKELEQLLQSLEVQKSVKNRTGRSPFASSFTFPQYSTSCNATQATASDGGSGADSSGDKSEAGVADIEVTMVEGHASLKVLSRRRPKQLLRLVAGLQQLRIPPLHLNVTTVDAMVLYSFSLKVEDGSKLGSVEDIAAAVHEILARIQREEEEAGRLSSSS
uniref:ACT domain-containing protein n=1 Tax=Aegilops tauschii TaxID=37682 RepID=M8D8C1_AEGTA